MSPRRSSWWLLAATVSAAIVVGSGGAQAAGGALDPSFGRGGKVLTSFDKQGVARAFALAVQADDKIVAAGFTRVGGAPADFALARYTGNGRLDPSFGRRGKAVTDLGGDTWDRAHAVAMQRDGKIVAAGESNGDFALARYTRDGKLDASFGTGGIVRTDTRYSTADGAYAVAVQGDGKIIAAGTGKADFVLARYTSGGKLDRSFGTGGKVLTDLGTEGDGEATAVAVQRDGKIVAAGWSIVSSNGEHNPPEVFALVRYTARGKLDASFGRGGKVLTSFGSDSHDWASAVEIQSDGKIVAAGGSDAKDPGRYDTFSGLGKDDFALARYTSGGRLDTSFGAGGKVLTTIGIKSDDEATAVAMQRDGKIVAAGYSTASGSASDSALARYTAAGKLDVRFGKGGKVVTDLGVKSEDRAYAVAVQRDGKIVGAGYSRRAFALARYTK